MSYLDRKVTAVLEDLVYRLYQAVEQIGLDDYHVRTSLERGFACAQKDMEVRVRHALRESFQNGLAAGHKSAQRTFRRKAAQPTR